MSELFDDDEAQDPGPPARGGSNRSRALVITLVVLVLAFFALTAFSSFYTDRLWFRSVGFSGVFTTLILTRIGLFFGFGALMAVVVGLNIALAYRYRPLFRAAGPDQANLDRYRDTLAPVRRWVLLGVSLVIGAFAGTSAMGNWRVYLLWRNRQPFGSDDAYFGKDIGFFVFSLPWWHFVVDFVMAVTVVALLAAAVVHYLYGGIRLQVPHDRFSGAAQVQLSVLVGVFVLAKAVDYFLDRYDLVNQSGRLFTGMHNTGDNAVLPAKNILVGIAVICALLFFLNVWRRTWQLPSMGLALLVVSSVLLGMIWPAIVQQFQVNPSEADKEAAYIDANIKATRDAYSLDEVQTTDYTSASTAQEDQLAAVSGQVSSVPLVDPQLVRQTFEQRQQARNYYSVAPVLDVDRYDIDDQQRALVLGARELDQSGITPSDRNWSNLHTVYTHGDGLIASYANQRPADNGSERVATDNEGAVWAEGIEADQKDLTQLAGSDGYQRGIYFGEKSPDYSIVGKASESADDVELGLTPSGELDTTTYDGKGGVAVGGLFNKLMYAIKFGEPNFLLSKRVNDNSKVLYDRTPLERVAKVAPWLTLDNDPYPAVVDGRVEWIVDGYTTTDRFPNSQRESFDTMTDDSLAPTNNGFQALPTDEINYMRNAVKATVDAYDGTVTLYAWDEEDPILQAWRGVFPGTVQPRSAIPEELLEHLRYPEDLFKVQRYQLAKYHVTDPGDFYQGSNRWQVPRDPNNDTHLQPPYRLFTGENGQQPSEGEDAASSGDSAGATAADSGKVWSLTSVFVPNGKENLSAFVAVDSDATSPDYGTIRVLEQQDTNTPGPNLIANQLQQDGKVADALRDYRVSGAPPPVFGNLLTLPVEDGLIYIEPVYAIRTASSGGYPILRFVLVSYGGQVGIDSTLVGALRDAFGVAEGTTPPTVTPPDTGGGGNGSGGGGNSPPQSVQERIDALLTQAQDAFDAADQALADKDTVEYARQIRTAQEKIAQAARLLGQRDTSGSSGSSDAGSDSGSGSATGSGSGG